MITKESVLDLQYHLHGACSYFSSTDTGCGGYAPRVGFPDVTIRTILEAARERGSGNGVVTYCDLCAFNIMSDPSSETLRYIDRIIDDRFFILFDVDDGNGISGDRWSYKWFTLDDEPITPRDAICRGVGDAVKFRGGQGDVAQENSDLVVGHEYNIKAVHILPNDKKAPE
ncbi:MAG: hypothetical protein ABIA21_04120 [Candidatus Aenigmatarchaeota archaeon]